MTFDVRFSDEAERNVREIRDWIKERSPAGAIKWFDALEHVKTRLTQSAENFGFAPEADAFDEPQRMRPSRCCTKRACRPSDSWARRPARCGF